jgi:group I intron endonuclease
MHSGIYQIVNVITNERYVGSTKNFSSRKAQHLCELRKGIHRTRRLQEAFIRFGQKSFRFSILEYVQTDQAHLFEREQFWIDKLNPEYNESLIAGKVIPKSARTPEAIARIGISVKKLWEDPEYRKKCSIPRNWKNGIPNRRGAKLSDETKQKIREANAGEKNPNYGQPKTQTFMDALCKTWEGLVSPDGVLQPPITNLAQFCREHGLDSGQMSRLMTGKAKSCKGWTKV